MFSRGPKAVETEPGGKYATFLKEAATILGQRAGSLDLSEELQSGYGCDELEIVELIQIAEDVWSISLMPTPFDTEDVKRATERFRTIGDIVNEAQSNRLE